MENLKDNVVNWIIEHKLIIIYGSIIIFILVTTYFLYKNTRRISKIEDLPRKVKGIVLTGIVTRVGDGDGFRMVHTPFLRSKFDRNTPSLSIRLAGIDAPEMAHFGLSSQPHAEKSRDFLKNMILKKKVTISIQSIDMYNRIVALVWIKSGFFSWTNISLKMLEKGMACVYDRTGAEYGGYKDEFLSAQEVAKKKKLGMWKDKNVILPMDYKNKSKK